jgi:hypothetical protein
LSAETWQSHQYRLQMPEAWNSAGVTFRIIFSKNQSLNGVLHTAYLDNVVLTQIPEPTVLGLLGVGGALLGATRRRRLKTRPA